MKGEALSEVRAMMNIKTTLYQESVGMPVKELCIEHLEAMSPKYSFDGIYVIVLTRRGSLVTTHPCNPYTLSCEKQGLEKVYLEIGASRNELSQA